MLTQNKMANTTATAPAAQGAATATGKKRGRPALNSRDPKQVIANIANRAIQANQRAIEAIKKTL